MTRLKTLTASTEIAATRLWEAFRWTFSSVAGIKTPLQEWPDASYEVLDGEIADACREPDSVAPDGGSIEFVRRDDARGSVASITAVSYSSRRRFTARFSAVRLTPSDQGPWRLIDVEVDFGMHGSVTAAWTLVEKYFELAGAPIQDGEYGPGEFASALSIPVAGGLSAEYFEPPAEIRIEEPGRYVVTGTYDDSLAAYDLEIENDCEKLRDQYGWSDVWHPFSADSHPLRAHLWQAVTA